MLLQFNLNRQHFEVSENKAGVDEELEVSLRESGGEVGVPQHAPLTLVCWALLFRFTDFKTGVSKGKQSQSQAFSIDHLSMQSV